MDPKGWVKNPPSTFVKVVNTSRDEVNGKFAIVLQYTPDRQRYIVHMIENQAQMALKLENLQEASFFEQMQAQYILLSKDPSVRRKITEFYNSVQSVTGIKPEYIGIGSLILFIALFFVLGFTKTLFLASFLVLVLMVIAPDIPGGSLPTIARNAPMRFRALLREHVPYGHVIANNTYLSAALAGLILFYFVSVLSKSYVVAKTAGKTLSNDLIQYYYKLGFQDASESKEFGSSLARIGEADEEFPEMEPTSKPSGFDWSILLSLFYVGKMFYDLGKDPVSGRWSPSMFGTNIKSMDTMRMGMFGLALYRLVSKFIY